MTVMFMLILLLEGVLAAGHHERIVRVAEEINFPLQGLQTTASADDLTAVRSGDSMSGRLSVRMVNMDGIQLHAVGAVLVDVLRTHHIKSMIDWPCREHRDIVPRALYLGMNVSITLELEDPKFRYYCMDNDSGELAQSSYAVRDVIGRRRGLNYVRQRVPGSFRISKTGPLQTKAAKIVGSDMREGAENSESTSDGARYDRQARVPSVRRESLGNPGSSGPVAALSKSNGALGLSPPELIFSWSGRVGGRNSTTEVKDLVLSAAASGAAFALIGAHAAYGTRWERPNATMGAVNDLTLGRLTGGKLPWFPFGNAIISMSDAYSPASEDNVADPRFLVLYRLDAVPESLVKKRRAVLKTDSGGELTI